jgi:aminoglycoside 6'-N-acetyltransferase
VDVVVRELRPGDGAPLRAMRATPEVARWWGAADPDFPFDDDDPATTFQAIEADGELAGFIQYSQEADPDYRHASIDLFVNPRRHRQGIGRGALAIVIRRLTEGLGHHRITIDPAAGNTAAIRCYEQAGFTHVGVMRAAWRDQATGEWSDALLMERVVAPAGRRG